MAYSKSDLLNDVASAAGVSKGEAEAVIGAFLDTIATQAKAGNKVAWPGFGSFQGNQRAARIGRNPKTGAEIQIPAALVMKFTAAKALKESLNS